MDGFANGTEHLLAEIGRLELTLQRQVLWLRAANLTTEDEFRGLYIPDTQVDALLNPKRHIVAPSPGDEVLEASQALTALIEQLRVEHQARVQASLQAGIDLPLPRLAQLFALSPFEVEVLLICVAPELDLGYETLYAYVQNDITRKRPSVDLALKLLCPTLEDRLACATVLAPDGALRRHRLVRLFDDPQDRDPALPARFMKADQRVVDFLLDRDKTDERLISFTRQIAPACGLAEMALPAELITQLIHATRSCAEGALAEEGGIFFFHGPYGVGKQAAAGAMCAELGLPLLVADLGPALAVDGSLAETLALLLREAALRGAGLYLALDKTLLADEKQARTYGTALARALAHPGRPIFLGSEIPWHPVGLWADTHFLSFEFPLPTFPLRLRLWERALRNNSHRLGANVDLAALADKFLFSAGQIRDAARQAAHLTMIRAADAGELSMDDLHAAARAQSNQGLRRLAQKIEPVYTWSDIVLPPRAMQQLHEVYASVKYRHVVYSRWGFERKLALGKGLNALFSGPSGTGKTMAAEILAHKLKLDLYKIDLSCVVSKYIGETEKNLDRIFREAKASNAILFFDEADALFGKRSEVRDAHDRYANIEVAYLLQKMEEYDGIVILATNLRKNMDEAFARRMHHTVEFPFPDAACRERIWEGMFPPEAPLADGVDFRFLAHQFELSGGNIRNIALAAAFMAAESDGVISMEHLILATAREFQKMGKLPSKASFRQYYELIRERG